MTLVELQERRAHYLRAEVKILEGQEYTVGDGVTQRTLRRADLAEVRQAIADLTSQISQVTAAPARRVLYIR